MRSTGGGDMKAFYRQQKPTGAISKKKQHKPAAVARLHPSPAADHGDAEADAKRTQEDEEEEMVAREFDMDMRYGPCLGLTRAQRWHRAAALGLAPPPDLIRHFSQAQPCLWEGRV